MTSLVVGRGLLGRRVAQTLAERGRHVGGVRVPWSDTAEALEVLRAAARDCAASDPEWDLIWTAGAGVVATPAEGLDREVALVRQFLGGLESPPRVFFLASSAGGVYAGSADPPFTEYHEPRPLVAYGRAKLETEAVARDLASRGTRVVIGRIANLYGPGQNLSKPQGLVSQLGLTHVTGRPLRLYVPMDTLRDYLYVDDAAEMVAATLDRAADEPAGSVVVKILASGVSVSVGALVDASRRAFRRRPFVVHSAPPSAGKQVLDLRLRSVVWPEVDALARTPLIVGLRATAQDVAAQHQRGLLERAGE